MARYHCSDPPAGFQNYKEYRDWLEKSQYQRICGYCLLQTDYPEIDHLLPKAHATSKINDPKNLILACKMCNLKKSDYHPNFSDRRRLKNDLSGFSVINILEHDLSLFYDLNKETGELMPKEGKNKQHAAWVISHVLDLNSPIKVNARKILVKTIKLITHSLKSLQCETIHPNNRELAGYVNMTLDNYCEQELFFYCLGIPVSEILTSILEEVNAVRNINISNGD